MPEPGTSPHATAEATAELRRLLYATDASIYQVTPTAVHTPTSIADARELLRTLADRGAAVLPRGGGTSLAGQGVAHAAVVDLSAGCREIDPPNLEQRRVCVDAGVTIGELNDRLGRLGTGLFFAPDPATLAQAAIGGVIGNNAAGARSVLFGRTVDHVARIDALLADGRPISVGPAPEDPAVQHLSARVAAVVRQHAAEIRERFPRTPRRNAGYALDAVLDQLDRGVPEDGLDLVPLLCGSEGTLAVTLRATLRLEPVPVASSLTVLAFESIEDAIDATEPLLATRPSAVELIDGLILELAAAHPGYRRCVADLPRAGGTPRAVLFVEHLARRDRAELDAAAESIRDLGLRAPMTTHTVPEEIERAWALRRAGEPLLHTLPGARKPLTFIEDAAVPVDRLSEYVRGMRELIAGEETTASFYAHASVGVLHIRPVLSLRDPEDRARMERLAQASADLARSLGGVMSGEHGDGRARGPLLERFFGPELMSAFREIKSIFDPDHRLNPGNIVRPAPIASIHTSLRIDPSALGETPRPATIPDQPMLYEFGPGGLGGAIEACNGAGFCRKRSGGTMCPTYRALSDETHSTRGRAGALRIALSGQLGPDPYTHPGVRAVLDSCLSCKACASECPSAVDMTRLKTEYLARAYARRGRPPARTRVTANLRTLTALSARSPRLTNTLLNSGPGGALVKKLMGWDRRRSLPRAGRCVRPGRVSSATAGPRVALFLDCFTGFGESAIGRAAMDLFGRVGVACEIISAGCCARPAISLGVVDTAARQIRSTLSSLEKAVRDPDIHAIVFLEPSCYSAVTDDWPALRLPGVDPARCRALAAKAVLAEAYFAREHTGLRGSSTPPLLVHEHCHQRSLCGPGLTARWLDSVCPGTVSAPDTGCCGMAGAWGYDAERFDLSVAVGELALFPAVRAAAEGTRVVASGTSCRHQLRDILGIDALHPVQAALRALQ